MPNVLMLFEYPTLNGGERSALALVDGIRDAGFQLLAAAPRNGELAECLRSSGLELVPFDVHDAEGVRRPREQLRQQLAAEET